jgi:hypothetical protein
MLKKKFSTLFTRCSSCDRLFRTAHAFHATCRTCRSDREMSLFFQWLEEKLALA